MDMREENVLITRLPRESLRRASSYGAERLATAGEPDDTHIILIVVVRCKIGAKARPVRHTVVGMLAVLALLVFLIESGLVVVIIVSSSSCSHDVSPLHVSPRSACVLSAK